MKKAGVIVAAVAAASSVAPNSKSDHYITVPLNKGSGSSKRKDGGSGSRRGSDGEKFAPRFDGLRFIETLVTAHR